MATDRKKQFKLKYIIIRYNFYYQFNNLIE